MKKEKQAENMIRQYLIQLYIQQRCGLIISDYRDEKAKYNDKFLRLLEIIGPLAKT
jgi:hypothetical protein